MKKKKMLTLCVSLVAAMLMTGCSLQPNSIQRTYINESGELIVEYTNGNIENLGNVNGDKGDTGDTGSQGPQGNPGQKGTDGNDGAPGTDGKNGTDGTVPKIGNNGNWWIGDRDTGISAKGEAGNPGQAGENGVVPHVGDNGNWFIGNVDTEIKANGEDGTDGNPGENGVVPHVGDNGNWFIGNLDTEIAAEGEPGEDGNPGLTPFIGNDGNWWIGETNTNVKATGTNGTNGSIGVGVDYVETSYELDSLTNKEYCVFKVCYDDDTDETFKVEVPKRITSIEYIGLTNYQLCEEDEEPTLKLKVTYGDKTTSEVDIIEDMYFVGDDFVKPDFTERGTYNSKVYYKGLSTTFSVRVIDPDYITKVLFISELEYDLVTDDTLPTLKLEVTYDGGLTEEVEITDNMFVIEDDYVKPNFKVPGEYKCKTIFCGIDVTFNITVNEARPDDLLVANDEFISGCYYFDGTLRTDDFYAKLKTHEQFIEPQKVRIVVEDSENDVSSYAYKIAFSAYDASGDILNPNDFNHAIFVMEDGVMDLDLRKLYPTGVNFRIDVMIHNGDRNFVDIPSTASIKVYSLQDIHKYEGKKIDILGDSITAQAQYFSTLKTLTGASTVYNNGLSGDKIISFASRVDNLHSDADLIIVFGGTNDYWHKTVNIGTITDTSGTFYGGLNSIYNAIKAKYPDKELLFVFPPHQTFQSQDDTKDFGHGTLDDFRTAMRLFCEAKGVDFYDLGTIQGWDPATHSSDGVHANSAGGALIGEGIFEHLVARD